MYITHQILTILNGCGCAPLRHMLCEDNYDFNGHLNYFKLLSYRFQLSTKVQV